MDQPTFAEYYDDRRPSGLTAYLVESAEPDRVREEILSSLGPGRSVFISTNASLRRQVIQVFDSTFAVTYALEAIAIFVSMFGIAATLLTLAFERRQQIATLRLVGAERWHIRRLIHDRGRVVGNGEPGDRFRGWVDPVSDPHLRDQRAELRLDDPVSSARGVSCSARRC